MPKLRFVNLTRREVGFYIVVALSQADLRWSQTANYGVLPNQLLPNTFIAQTYDLPDPWTHNMSTYDKHCAIKDPATGKYGPDCVWDDSEWMGSTKAVVG